MVRFNGRGLMPAVFTPLNEDLTVNCRVIPVYAQFLQKFGIKSVLGEWVPTMKAGMEIVTGIRMGPPLLPLKPISEEAKKRIEGKLRSLNLVK